MDYSKRCLYNVLYRMAKYGEIVNLGDLDPLTVPSNGRCLCRARGSVYVEYGVVFKWFGLSYTIFNLFEFGKRMLGATVGDHQNSVHS